MDQKGLKGTEKDWKETDRGWKGMKGAERDGKGLQGTERDEKGLKRNEREWKGMKENERDLKGLKGTERDWKGMKGTERDWKGMKGTARDWKRLKGLKVPCLIQHRTLKTFLWLNLQILKLYFLKCRNIFVENKQNFLILFWTYFWQFFNPSLIKLSVQFKKKNGL